MPKALLSLALTALLLAGCDAPVQDPEPLEPAPIPQGEAAGPSALTSE